jgi:hypothetical protein
MIALRTPSVVMIEGVVAELVSCCRSAIRWAIAVVGSQAIIDTIETGSIVQSDLLEADGLRIPNSPRCQPEERG